jgi:hypothetical protein
MRAVYLAMLPNLVLYLRAGGQARAEAEAT